MDVCANSGQVDMCGLVVGQLKDGWESRWMNIMSVSK